MSIDFTMASSSAFGGLEQLLDRVTNPQAGYDVVQSFIQAVKSEQDGPKDAIHMLLDKVRSPNPAVALKALSTLEAVVASCGRDAEIVIGKFRFLNELIKMVSPKYGHTPEAVRAKVLELIQIWAHRVQGQPKIKEVYDMLKKQGVAFPSYVPEDDEMEPVPSKYRESPLESDPRKAKLLEKLLKSNDPNDLMKANKLIKKMVKEDAKRETRIAQLRTDLEAIDAKIKLLSEMIAKFDPNEGRLEDNEVIQELMKELRETRPRLIKLAGEIDEKDNTLGEVLAANDDISRVLDQYSATLSNQPPPSNHAPHASVSNDLFDLGIGTTPTPQPQAQSQPSAPSFDAFASFPSSESSTQQPPITSNNDLLGDLLGPSTQSNSSDLLSSTTSQASEPAPQSSNGLDDLLGEFSGLATQTQENAPPDLSGLFISMDSIQTGDVPPVPVYDKNNIKVLFQFAKHSPHPRIHVIVISIVNLNSYDLENVVFQSAVPKSMQVKLQPPSAERCPALSITGTTSPISQVMLWRNPEKESLRLRYKLMFTANGNPVEEIGEYSNFPVA